MQPSKAEKNPLKAYFAFMTFCFVVLASSPLLPWASYSTYAPKTPQTTTGTTEIYGSVSKSGIDVSSSPLLALFGLIVMFYAFHFLAYRFEKIRKAMLIIAFAAGIALTGLFAFETARLLYLTSISNKEALLQMFGFTPLSAGPFRIGYGLWLGTATAAVATVVNLVTLKLSR